MNQELSREYDTHRLVGGEGNAYVTFLTTQLKPYLDQNFPTKIDDYGIVGSSMGALISFYAFLKYPTIFKKCAILSTAFWIYEEEFVKLLKVSSISHNMLYMDVGGQEEDERYIPSNLHLKECIEEKNDHFHYHFFPKGRHSEYDWSQRVPLFLKMFYKGE